MPIEAGNKQHDQQATDLQTRQALTCERRSTFPRTCIGRRCQMARDTSRTLSETVADLIRRGLGYRAAAPTTRSDTTNLPLVRLGMVITTEDVRALDDEAP
jgi:hypothetical protein